MRKKLAGLVVLSVAALLVAACGSSPKIGTCTANCPTPNPTPTAQTAPVSISMTDDPPSGVNVLFFQVSLTAASLMPASSATSSSPVSLLPDNTPIEVDVTKLQALSAFLSTASVPVGSYSSLSLTFANPQLVIFNTSDQGLASTCAIGSVCTLTPTLDNSATVSLSGSPFPVTIAEGSPLGFMVDFHLNTIIQSDLSVNLGASNGVAIAQLPPVAPSVPPQFGFLTGTVGTIAANSPQFTLTSAWGRTFTIDTNSSTTFNGFPPLMCNTVSCSCNPGSFICLAAGQTVQVQVGGIESDGALLATQVTYVQAPNQQTVEGTIVAIPPLPLPAGETVVELLLHQNPTAISGAPLGGIAWVAVWSNASGETSTTFSIDSNGFTLPSNASFASVSDLAIGQDLQVTIVPGSIQKTSPVATAGVWQIPAVLSFAASNLQLEPSQMTGTISSTSSPDFTLNVGVMQPCAIAQVGIACPQVIALVPFNVITTSQTNYLGFTPESFSGLQSGQTVSVNGWLFKGPGGGFTNLIGPPIVVAQTVALHPNATY